MASPCPNLYCFNYTKIPKLPSTDPLSWSPHPSNLCGFNGISLHRPLSRTCAKFEKFQGEVPQDSVEGATTASSPSIESEQETSQVEEEDDSCLPSDLVGAVQQSGQASAAFVSSGGMRAIVELLIPQLQFLDDEGAQAELWELSRVFLNTLIEETGCQRVKAIFPDAGAAALLKYRWQDAAFGFSSLSDRKPVSSEDDIIVMVVPDYQMLEYVERIASGLSDDPHILNCLFNETSAGWSCVQMLSRIIFGDVDEKSEKGPSLFDRAAGIFSSVNRFMKVISR
ncbi:DUF1995 domain protein, putative [Actinidia rufa]|uniref:DUF1995 domain protein, putative n=1 Tax=Actinidia rufa TaxID=165716 RepID=A0A7J0FWX1_9ERIC|nr:DUF1995 domain protein, putative [Actinidia rufa]